MPMHYLIALFIGMPILELALLIKLHNAVGFVPTVLLVLATGIAGAALVRRQGVAILFKIQQEMANGNLPAP
ncbi:MAG: FxsA family protein, partial [Verrucomicrobiota bacterium]|nr:FxsA family protein [Verrucomicrobiota bacterium]